MLLEEIISKSNMHLAYERVVGNKGAAGVDGIGMLDFASEVKTKWPLIKIRLEKRRIPSHGSKTGENPQS
ncbi:hypothetical protein [Pedobacter caeni]|uniref:Reverse transcriptase (RNA-dependent DNA polymerase) n=1 Tax=Pedobacter caeni TaxID=288992 RepID=A0A1M5JBX8_9SPHI|nr:hypothetical protein [Pedobacter caeni]SHG37799.1 hypothetical protein SAMN04488522_105275 [Pedobacter caeni]